MQQGRMLPYTAKPLYYTITSNATWWQVRYHNITWLPTRAAFHVLSGFRDDKNKIIQVKHCISKNRFHSVHHKRMFLNDFAMFTVVLTSKIAIQF